MGFATTKLWITKFFFQSYIGLSDYYFIFFSVHPGQLHPGQLTLVSNKPKQNEEWKGDALMRDAVSGLAEIGKRRPGCDPVIPIFLDPFSPPLDAQRTCTNVQLIYPSSFIFFNTC